MAYVPQWMQKRSSARPPEDTQPSLSRLALEEMKRAEPEPPLGGWAGESAIPDREPAPLAPPEFVIEPPDWAKEEAEQEARDREARIQQAAVLLESSQSEAGTREEIPGYPPIAREPA